MSRSTNQLYFYIHHIAHHLGHLEDNTRHAAPSWWSLRNNREHPSLHGYALKSFEKEHFVLGHAMVHFSKMSPLVAKTWLQNDFNLGKSRGNPWKDRWLSIITWPEGSSSRAEGVTCFLGMYRRNNGTKEGVRRAGGGRAEKRWLPSKNVVVWRIINRGWSMRHIYLLGIYDWALTGDSDICASAFFSSMSATWTTYSPTLSTSMRSCVCTSTSRLVYCGTSSVTSTIVATLSPVLSGKIVSSDPSNPRPHNSSIIWLGDCSFGELCSSSS